MTVTSIMTTGTEIAAKAGDGASAGYTEAMQTAAVLQAEALINLVIGYDCSTNWGDLETAYKPTLGRAVASIVAIAWIKYDMGGYTDLTEATDMIKVLDEDVLFILSLIRGTDKKALITKNVA